MGVCICPTGLWASLVGDGAVAGERGGKAMSFPAFEWLGAPVRRRLAPFRLGEGEYRLRRLDIIFSGPAHRTGCRWVQRAPSRVSATAEKWTSSDA